MYNKDKTVFRILYFLSLGSCYIDVYLIESSLKYTKLWCKFIMFLSNYSPPPVPPQFKPGNELSNQTMQQKNRHLSSVCVHTYSI